MSRSALPARSESEHISLLRLLGAFLKIGSIGFGGGMAVIALMERENQSPQYGCTPANNARDRFSY